MNERPGATTAGKRDSVPVNVISGPSGAGTTALALRWAHMRIERLKVCLNGGRDRRDHAAVPLTPAELAASAAGAVAAGAEAVHLHPRRADGRESLQAADVAAAVAAVRGACPATPVGVSTGLWITGDDPAARRAAVAAWADLPPDARPDFASVNLSEPGWAGLCGLLASAGVAAEAGVWSEADADQLAAGAAADWLRVLVEIAGVPAARAVAAGVLRRLDELGVTAPRLLHGEGATCWLLWPTRVRSGCPPGSAWKTSTSARAAPPSAATPSSCG